ncbi:hypothetical protein FB45DRAFT_886535 [Roridomyces roridus]|uniref:AAA-like domain protein n=1 Tax=Roridomyces roridus TaxID=1738132 RepID=A0AAD7CII4_9AGAR|nr:hypothetical protein FB45DRAFT_886535 [Roridomyces roridus]
MSGTAKVQFIFIDKFHRKRPECYHAELTGAEREQSVAYLITKAQDMHRASNCTVCGALKRDIIVKCAWIRAKGFPDVLTANSTIPEDLGDLEQDPSNETVFMLPQALISEYITDSETGILIRVLFECTYRPLEVNVNATGARPLKREHGDDTAPDEWKRRKLDNQVPQELRVLRPSSDDSDIRLNILPPSFAYPVCGKYAGVAFVDKTRFIPHIMALLLKNHGSIIISPKGNGSSTLGRLMALWCDIKARRAQAEWDNEFGSATIGPILRQRLSENAKFDRWGAMNSLCLTFNMRKIPQPTKDVTLSQRITAQLRQTIRDFVGHYENVFAGNSFDISEDRTIKAIMTDILATIPQKRNLFVILDHWDAPIQFCIQHSLVNSIKATQSTLTRFMNDLLWLSEGPLKKLLLLVIGNLPPPTKLANLKDISSDPTLQGAFGITPKELDALITVLSWGERTQFHFDPKDAKWKRKLGYDPVTATYNFTLVLHHLSVDLGLENEHKKPPKSSLLRSISKSFARLLDYSNLRHDQAVQVPPFSTFNTTSLNKTIELPLWQLLYYLGALQIAKKVGRRALDQMWVLVISSDFVKGELFSACQAILPGSGCPHDMIIRALTERNPWPLIHAITTNLLYNKTLAELHKMGEVTFQSTFDGFFNHAKETNYFTQLALLRTVRTLNDSGLDIPSNERSNGFADIFLSAFLRLHPGRVLIIELKMVSVWQLLKAQATKVKGGKVPDGPDDKGFREKCLGMINKVDNMTFQELCELEYCYMDRHQKTMSQPKSIRRLLQESTGQLRSYLNALVEGPSDGTSEGIRPRVSGGEWRVRAVEVRPNEQPDEVIGLIICCIGRRLVPVAVEPTTQNTKYRYGQYQGWEQKWEGRTLP